jgi:hypothetical protein
MNETNNERYDEGIDTKYEVRREKREKRRRKHPNVESGECQLSKHPLCPVRRKAGILHDVVSLQITSNRFSVIS